MVFDRPYITASPEETKRIGETLANYLIKPAGVENSRIPVLCQYGDLGSGKTTFVQGFAHAIGIKSRLLSPTFIIVRRYNTKYSSRKLFHIDLYRMQNLNDLKSIGIDEILSDRQNFVAIEWAEKLGADLPHDRIDIRFSVRGDEHHEINIQKIQYGQ